MTRRSIAAGAVSMLLVGLSIDTAIAQSIEGTAWNAIELYGIPVAGPFTTTDRQPHLVFGANGRLSGSDGWNQLTGPYTVKANDITFGQIAGTQMACLNVEDVVKRFRAALTGTRHWNIVKGRLQFYGATGKPLAVFEQRQTASGGPVMLQGTTWHLIKFQGGGGRTLIRDDPAKYTIEFAAGGSLAARVDCNRGRGSWKVTPPSQIELGPLALTRARCPEGSLHDQIARQWTSVRSFVIRDGRCSSR